MSDSRDPARAARAARRTPGPLALAAAFLSLVLAAAPGAPPARAQIRTPSERQFLQLAHWISGSYSSAAQAARDTSYRDVQLHVTPIWTERGEGYRWYYLEQALASAPARPFRQRVYRMSDLADGTFLCVVYALPRPQRFAGEWRAELPLVRLSPDSLLEREGCELIFRRSADGSFAGATRERRCPSELRGAKWTTSEAVVTRERLLSLERGYDSTGVQVWGPTKGAYEFLRVRDR